MLATAIDSSGGYGVHFGLREPPFSLTPNPRYVFESRAHRAALEHITAGFCREGFTIVTGEVGTGKTMLCRVVAEQRDPRVFLAILTKLPATAEEFLRHLLVEFGVIARGNPRMAEVGRFELLNSLEQFLASLVPLGVRAVAIIDDAHRLAQEVLEEIRVVSDLNVESHRLLHVVLLGQPELDTLLGRAEQRSLLQRVTSRHSLQPLDADEVSSYVERRLQIAAGNLTARALFEPSAVRAAAELSRGVPRVINVPVPAGARECLHESVADSRIRRRAGGRPEPAASASRIVARGPHSASAAVGGSGGCARRRGGGRLAKRPCAPCAEAGRPACAAGDTAHCCRRADPSSRLSVRFTVGHGRRAVRAACGSRRLRHHRRIVSDAGPGHGSGRRPDATGFAGFCSQHILGLRANGCRAVRVARGSGRRARTVGRRGSDGLAGRSKQCVGPSVAIGGTGALDRGASGRVSVAG